MKDSGYEDNTVPRMLIKPSVYEGSDAVLSSVGGAQECRKKVSARNAHKKRNQPAAGGRQRCLGMQ